VFKKPKRTIALANHLLFRTRNAEVAGILVRKCVPVKRGTLII
jgi:hypothetical protein